MSLATTISASGATSGALPCTEALRRRLSQATNDALIRDLLYLEAWERDPQPGAGAALRINQIRRANPELAAEIRAELAHVMARPMTRPMARAPAQAPELTLRPA